VPALTNSVPTTITLNLQISPSLFTIKQHFLSFPNALLLETIFLLNFV
jgi:hypothetical protein